MTGKKDFKKKKKNKESTLSYIIKTVKKKQKEIEAKESWIKDL